MLKDFDALWAKFGDIPVNCDDETEIEFLHFPAGTNKLDVWRWFEQTFQITLGAVLSAG